MGVGKSTEFQSAVRTREKCVVLEDFGRAVVGDSLDPRQERFDAIDAGFDVDIACDGEISLNHVQK